LLLTSSPTKLSTLATTPVPLSGLVGVGLADSATLSGGYNPGGTISFRLYGPTDPSCVLAPAFAETVTVAGNGSYGPTALAVTATAAGVWQWAATYSGDANNAAATSGCDKEQIAIAKRAPVLATAADPTTTMYGTTLGAAATLFLFVHSAVDNPPVLLRGGLLLASGAVLWALGRFAARVSTP